MKKVFEKKYIRRYIISLLSLLKLSIQNPYYLRKFYKTLKRDGLKPTLDRLRRYIVYEYEYKPIVFDIKSYETLEFPKNQNLLVSIIIPVHNKFDFTYKCL